MGDEFSVLFAKNAKAFLDNPAVRPSGTAEQRQVLDAYVKLFDVLHGLENGTMVIVPVDNKFQTDEQAEGAVFIKKGEDDGN